MSPPSTALEALHDADGRTVRQQTAGPRKLVDSGVRLVTYDTAGLAKAASCYGLSPEASAALKAAPALALIDAAGAAGVSPAEMEVRGCSLGVDCLRTCRQRLPVAAPTVLLLASLPLTGRCACSRSPAPAAGARTGCASARAGRCPRT